MADISNCSKSMTSYITQLYKWDQMKKNCEGKGDKSKICNRQKNETVKTAIDFIDQCHIKSTDPQTRADKTRKIYTKTIQDGTCYLSNQKATDPDRGKIRHVDVPLCEAKQQLFDNAKINNHVASKI